METKCSNSKKCYLFISVLIVIGTEHFNYPDTLKYHKTITYCSTLHGSCMHGWTGALRVTDEYYVIDIV